MWSWVRVPAAAFDLRESEDHRPAFGQSEQPLGPRRPGGERRGIRINCISPSPVLTPFLNDTRRMPGAEEALARFPIPLGRHSEPEEQAAVLLFLGPMPPAS